MLRKTSMHPHQIHNRATSKHCINSKCGPQIHPHLFPSIGVSMPHCPNKNAGEEDGKYVGPSVLERLLLAHRHATASLQTYEDQIAFRAELQSSSRLHVSLQPFPCAAGRAASPVPKQRVPGAELWVLILCKPFTSLWDAACWCPAVQ